MSDDKEAAKAMIRSWVQMQRDKYGENWIEIKAQEMADQATPAITALLSLRKETK